MENPAHAAGRSPMKINMAAIELHTENVEKRHKTYRNFIKTLEIHLP
jgi:hypothetical protein